MANSVKLLNYVDPEGEFLRFYTELDSDFEIGDKVFIVGGNYDNTIYTDKSHPDYDPFNKYAAGYEVISVDNTTLSNAVTLNISYRDAKFTSGGIETFIFDPKPVYKTEDELILNPNQPREAFISKSYFKRGEFNGGKFEDGIFGEYNIKGVTSSKLYQRQKFVEIYQDRLEAVLVSETASQSEIDDATQKLATISSNATLYTQLETPAINNKAKFNNNFISQPAEWSGGVFLGGDWQWGEWKSKYSDTKIGKRQQLNENFGIRNILDNSKYDIISFEDNNGGVGYNQFVTGNFGRIYEGTHNIDFIEGTSGLSDKIKINDYVPYPVKQSSIYGFDIQVKIESSKNNRIFDVTLDGNYLILKSEQIYTKGLDAIFTIKQEIFNESLSNAKIEFYIKDGNKPNRFTTGKVLSADWFGGIFEKGLFEGGDWHGGEFRSGTITSKYQRTNWYNGIFNGERDSAFAEDLKWYNGYWLNGNWKGDSIIDIKGITYGSNTVKLDIHTKYKHLLQIGENVFLSYFKKSLLNAYLDNFTDLPDVNLINFQSFKLTDIVEDDVNKSNFKVTIILEGKADQNLNDINLQYAKVSQSFFKKGVWSDGIWESGLREVKNYKINSFGTNFLPYELEMTLDNVVDLSYGDYVEVCNLNIVKEVDVEYLSDDVIFNRTDQEFLESLDLTLTISEISGNTIKAKLPINSSTGLVDIPDFKTVRLIQEQNGKTELASCLWWNGEFRSGSWRGGIWREKDTTKQSIFNNFLYFDTINTQIQSVWQSGYWKSGLWKNGIFLSGVWQSGVWENGIMTNTYGNLEPNSEIGWSEGDSVWMDGTWQNGTFKRGIFKKGKMINGTIINGAIEKIDWDNGVYTNGFGEYTNTINTNRSGKFESDKKEYSSLSAPSLIYIDGDGWIQLDQPSFYQKDYNIIFQDLDLYGTSENPYNNQMFNILNRDKFGTKLKIESGDTSGSYDNPVLTNLQLPILAIDNLVDVCEIFNGTNGSSGITNHIAMLADSTHKRILEVDVKTGKVDVFGKIVGDTSKSLYTFTDIKHIFKATSLELPKSNLVYVVDGSVVKIIDTVTKSISTITPVLQSIENIMDIWVAPTNNIVGETLFLITNLGYIHYWMVGWDTFKQITVIDNANITTSSQYLDIKNFCGVRGENSTRVHFIINGATLTGKTELKHAILDFSLGDESYQLNGTPSSDDLYYAVDTDSSISSLFNSGTVGNVVAKLEDGIIKIWLLLNLSNGKQDVYSFKYLKPFLNVFNEKYVQLNNNDLDYPISKLRLGYEGKYLILVGKKDQHNVLFATAKLSTNNIGFVNPTTEFKLFDIHQSISNLAQYKYLVYDSDDILKRVIYVDESLPKLYNELNIDTIEPEYEVIQLFNGFSSNQFYAIVKINNQFTVRSITTNASDLTNNSNLPFFYDNIYDAVYAQNTDLIFLAVKDGSTNKIVKYDVYNQTITDVVTVTGNQIKLDIIFDSNTGFDTGVIWTDDNKIYEFVDNGSTVLYEIFNQSISSYVSDVVDLTIDSVTIGANTYYYLFIAKENEVLRSFSDIHLTNNYRWSEFHSYYSQNNIDEVYKNNQGKIVIKHKNRFDLVDNVYSQINNLFQEVVIDNSTLYSISNQTIVQSVGSSGTNIMQGMYNEIGRPNYFVSDTPTNTNLLLSNPKSLIYAKNYGTNGTDDYLFFIDGTYSNYNIIRNINLNTNIKDITHNVSLTYEFKDISYGEFSKRIYVTYKDGSNNRIGYFTSNNHTISIIGSDPTIVWKKISAFREHTNTYDYLVALTTDNKIYLFYTSNGTSYTRTTSPIFNGSTENIAIDDLSFFVQSTMPYSYQVFYTINGSGLVSLLINRTDPTSDPWINTGTGYDNIVHINEQLNGTSGNVVLMENPNTIHLISTTGSFSEDRLFVKDFYFETDGSSESIAIYNEPSVGDRGIVFENWGSDTDIFMSLNNQVNISDTAGTNFQKVVTTDSDTAYVLFETGVYKITKNGIVESVPLPLLEYRDDNDPTPVGINLNYIAKPVDITAYPASGTSGKLLILYQIIDSISSTPTNYYDVFEFRGDISVLPDKASLDYLYGINNAAITSTGVDSTEIFPSDGGIKYLFKSLIKPKIFAKSDSSNIEEGIYLYFNDVNTSLGSFFKIAKANNIQILQNSNYSDIVLKVTPYSFNSGVEQIVDAYLYPNPLGGSEPLGSTSFYTTSYNFTPLFSNEFVVEFKKPDGQLFNSTSGYSLTVRYNLDASQIVPNPFTDVYDFKVYFNGVNDEIVIREDYTDNPINVDADTYWKLNKVGTGEWDIVDVGTLNTDRTLFSLVSTDESSSFNITLISAINNGETLNITTLPLLDINYGFTTLIKGYKVAAESNKVLSPFITARILYGTNVNNNVTFNQNGNPYSAHVVSTRWQNGTFVGSWNTPTYLDHNIIDTYSVFINGIFQGNFYSGFMLGGTFRNFDTGSILHQGHFLSDSSDLNWLSGSINSDTRYDVKSIKWESNKLKVLVEALKYESEDYINVPVSKITRGSIVQIPSLFKKDELEIHEVKRGDIAVVDGYDEIILKVDKPDFYHEDFWKNTKIFISSVEFTEFLFGGKTVTHSYISGDFMYLVIRSKFNFTNGNEYVFGTKPKIIIGKFLTVEDKIEVGKYSELTFDLPIPQQIPNIVSPTISDKIKLVQKYYLSDNIDALPYGDYTGQLVIPDYLQVFSFSFNKTYNDVNITFTDVAKNIYFSDIISDDNSSMVSVKLASLSGEKFAQDIVVENSYITSNNVNDWIENSIFLSGKTDRRWLSGAWLNIDEKGFANGKSQFGSSTVLPKFEGDPIKILDIYFEGDMYIWIQLEKIALNIDKYRYITLRGFTGNKSNIIGSTRSKVFRIIEIDNTWIKLKNPFAYYTALNIVSPSPYLKDFNMDELQLQTQTMSLKNTTGTIGVETTSTNQVFDYSYASVSCWNGGDFYGDFYSVWNAGNFRSGNFINGAKWFGSPESYSWQGLVTVTSEDIENSFELTMDLSNVSVKEKDLVYVKFNPSFNDNSLIETYESFYSIVEQEGTSGLLLLKYKSNILLPDGEYAVNIVRYRTEYTDISDITILENNNLIVDYNVNLASNNDVNTHLWLDRAINGTSSNYVIAFNGSNSIATYDLINTALNSGNVGEMTIDFHFKYIDTGLVSNPIFGFHLSETEEKLGFKLYTRDGKLRLEYHADDEKVDKILDSPVFSNNNWYHVALFINKNESAFNTLKYLVGSNSSSGNISDWDIFNGEYKYNLNWIGQALFDVSDIQQNLFKGSIDEFRVWSKDMSLFFTPTYNYQTKKFVNKYIPELIAYYSGDQVLDNAQLYPEEEQFFVLNDIKTKYLDTAAYNNKVENAIYQFDFLANKFDGKTTFKIATVEEERYTNFKYYFELFLVDNATNPVASTSGLVLNPNTFSIMFKESIYGTGVTDNKNKYVNLEANLEYWKWYNVILTEKGIYINNILLGNYKLGNRNIFKHTINTRITIGDTDYLTANYKSDVNLASPTYMRGFVKNVNVWNNKNTKEDYIIYRIISPEDIDNFTLDSTSGNINSTTGSSTISDPSAAFVSVPYFNSDGSMPWEHYIYTTENYYKEKDSFDKEITYTKALQDGGIVPDEFDDDLKYINVSQLDNALPEPTWLEGTDFAIIGTMNDDYPPAIKDVSNMSNFKLFGKTFSKDGQTKLTVSLNGFMTLSTDPSTYGTYSIDDSNETTLPYKQLSSVDMMFLMFTDIYLPNRLSSVANSIGGKWEIADREDETIVRFYTLFIIDQQLHKNFNYFACRLDKKNNNILFYNRRIKHDPSHQKIQGIRRSDGTWNYVNDKNRLSYYKYKAGIKDYIIGYDNEVNNQNNPSFGVTNLDVSKNTEYVLFIPRNIEVDEMTFIPSLYEKDYDYLKTNKKVEIVNSYNNKTETQYSYVVDGTAPVYDFYYSIDVDSTSGIVSYTSPVNNTYTITEQFNINSAEYDVARVSFFHNGNFYETKWHNGLFINGNIKSNGIDKFIWKFGIKYNGFITEGTLPVSAHAHWLGGFHLGENNTAKSATRNLIWYRGYWNGGTWESGNWLALDLTNSYLDGTSGTSFNNHWSVWDKGEWYSHNKYKVVNPVKVTTTGFTSLSGLLTIDGVTLLDGDRVLVRFNGTNNGIYIAKTGTWIKSAESTTALLNTIIYVEKGTTNADKYFICSTYNSTSIIFSTYNHYALGNSESVWHGGIWNSDIIEDDNYLATYTYQSNEFKFYKVRTSQIELPKVNSIWLGGLWLRGEFNGGIFANGFWNSVKPSKTTTSTYEDKINYTYDVTMSKWSKGMMLNSIWEGGTVKDSVYALETVFGDITNFDYIDSGDDFNWDSNEFKFKTNDNFSETILGKKVFKKDSYSLTKAIDRVFGQFNFDSIMSVYWKRGIWENGMFQFSYWQNLNLSGQDSKKIINDTINNTSIFQKGYFYSSYWENGLWNNSASGNSIATLSDNSTSGSLIIPNSIFYRSQWEKGYWKADGLDASTSGSFDGIEITDGLFSRSIWNAGVFEGGLIDLSVWRSGVSGSGATIDLTYKGTTKSLTYADSGLNPTYAVPSGVLTPLTNANFTGIANDSNFLNNIANDLRYNSGVDNFASVFVNGWMRGSVWHGGIWQRGMFSHREFTINDKFNFFDDDFLFNTVDPTENVQVGVWLRGLWLSGYFSYFNDRSMLTTTNNSHLDSTNGIRSLYMSIKAKVYAAAEFDTNSILGLSNSGMSDYIVNLGKVSDTNKHASIFSRKMIKNGANRYFSIFNGSFINGVLYDSTVNADNTRLILSVFSTVGKYGYDYHDQVSSPTDVESIDNINNFNVTTNIRTTKISDNTFFNIPYIEPSAGIETPVLYWDNGSTSYLTVDTSSLAYLNDVYNGNFYAANNNGIWRHNHSVVGDGTSTSELPSIAQGIATKWNPNDPEGEPNYTGLTEP